MSKKLVTLTIVMALALVVVSGNYFSAQAICCAPGVSQTCNVCPSGRDADKPDQLGLMMYPHGAQGNGYDYGLGGAGSTFDIDGAKTSASSFR